VFPKSLASDEVLIPQDNQSLLIGGAMVQAIMVAAQDFIPPPSKNFPCWSKPGDFHYEVRRQGNIIFVKISADQYSCDRGYGALDFGARYAISADGRILRRLDAPEPDWAVPAPEASEPEDGGTSRVYDIEELVPMISGPVDDPPFFTRPEWQEKHPVPWRKPGTHLPLDGGTPDGGFLSDGGSSATPSQER
jgi:hypothetical protein